MFFYVFFGGQNVDAMRLMIFRSTVDVAWIREGLLRHFLFDGDLADLQQIAVATKNFFHTVLLKGGHTVL